MITTAQEFLIQKRTVKNNDEQMMIEFAKMHVTEALKQASEKIKMKAKKNIHELDMCDNWMEVDKQSILNAYPL